MNIIYPYSSDELTQERERLMDFFGMSIRTARNAAGLLVVILLASCAVNKTAADTVVLSGKVEKVYDPCAQTLTNYGSAVIDKPPGITLFEQAMAPALKRLDRALATPECLYLIRQANAEQVYFRTSKDFTVGSCVKVYLTAEKMRALKSINPLMTNTLVEPFSAIEASDCS